MQLAQWAYPVSTGYPDQAQRIERHLRAMQRRYRARDQRWEEVRQVRRGEFDYFPDMISEAFPKPIIQNFIDTTAHDLAEMLAPLPSFNCSGASMRSNEERKRADLRTKIANNYISNSRMEVQMLYGADHYWTWGMSVWYVEPDFEEKLPRIVVEDPTGGYPEWDRWDRLRSYTKRFFHDAHVLADLYPEYSKLILKQAEESVGSESEWQLEMIRYSTDEGTVLVLGGKHPLVLETIRHKTKRMPFVIAKRPTFEPMEIKGQFDDVVWIQLARDQMAKLQFEAVEKAVQAPLALPADVQDISIGPDAVIRSQNPREIRRVGMEMTNMSFLESNTLQQDLHSGARYPAVRQGEVDASVVTGRGALELQSGLNTQLRAAQTVLKNAYMDVLALCFEMDEKIWPDYQKSIKVVLDGTPMEVKYTPSKDIASDHSVDVEYGFAYGLDPNRATVMLLQLRAEKLFSRDYMARQLPFDIDVVQEAQKVNTEDLRDALLQGVFGYVQAIPAMAQQGLDPSEGVMKAAAFVKGIQKGKSIEDVALEIFAPKPPPEGAPGLPGTPGGGGPGGGLPGTSAGLNPSGLMTGVAQGQAGMPPGGRPDLNMMLAGLTSTGKPQMSSMLMRRRRV